MRARSGARRLAWVLGLGALGCPAKPAPSPVSAVPPAANEPSPTRIEALEALRAGRLGRVAPLAAEALAEDPGDAQVQVAMALGLYHDAAHAFWADMMEAASVTDRPDGSRGFDHARGRRALTTTEEALARVEEHLARAAEDPSFSLELCLACWEVDWNQRGGVDEADRLLFQIERDAEGSPLPPDDPRRKPVFRFDRGDVYWARAMVSFQRALLDFFIAYDWTELDALFAAEYSEEVTVRLRDRARIAAVRALLLAGLEHSARARAEYLAETDDDREWVPAPDQHDHPMPLPMDERVYETWEGCIGDLVALLEGREGLSVAQIAQLGDHQWADPPTGYLSLHRMFESPSDVTIPLRRVGDTDWSRRERVEATLAMLFGRAYVPEMKASQLPDRLARMKREVADGTEPLERKLRYLLWVN